MDAGSCLVVLEAHRGRTTTGKGTWTANASDIPGETTFEWSASRELVQML